MSFFKSLGSVLRDILPTFAAALPIPGLGNVARRVLTDAFGLDPESSDDKIASAASKMTGEQLAHLQEKQIDLQKAALQSGVDLEKIAAGDRDSARNRQIQLKDETPNTLAYIITGATILFSGAVMFFPMQADSKIIFYILGTFTTLTTQVFNYLYGTSRSSRKKDNDLSQNITPDMLKNILSFQNKDGLKANYVTH